MESKDVSFGAWVSKRRQTLDLTRKQLAQCAGCSVSALRKIESDERRPSRQLAELLAQCLQIPPEEHPTFVKVARGVERVERLKTSVPMPASIWPSPTPPSPASNLPTLPTTLIGRETELATLARLLRDPQCRLLTLIGPGGIGKTRLAIETARAQQSLFPNGAFFVALVSLTSPQFIVPAIADALGFVFSGPLDPQAQILNYLREKQLLLVLDNFEHLLEGSDLLADLLQHAPGVKLLVTSRERLNLQGEWLFDLQGLPVPPSGQMDGIEAYSAVGLFIQSARRAQSGFALKAEDRPLVAHICRLVEGMPLAIELAAAWVRVLSCAEIAAEIERNLDFLAGGARDVPGRHRSLRATFDHSWKLLAVDERDVLCRLAVFQGGFEREAAEQIAGASLPILSALVDKSLLRRGESGRYDLHEVVRQYSWERLQESGQEEITRQRQARFFLTLAQTAESQMYTKQASFWLNRLEQEIDNLRSVLAWAVEPAEGDLASERITTGLLLTSDMTDFWFLRGYHHEGLARFRELLARPEAAEPTQARGKALIRAGYLLWSQGHLAEARSILEEALTINTVTRNKKYLAMGLENLGRVAASQGDYPSAQAFLAQSLAIWRELKAGFQIASVLSELGDIALLQQDYQQAEQFYARGIALDVTGNDEARHAYPLRRLAYLVLRRGDCAQAVRLCQESLNLNLNIYDRRGVVACLIALASIARMHGQFIQAATLFGAAEAILASITAPLLPTDQREYDHNVTALTRQLGPDKLAAAWAEGQAMSIERAVAYALAATGSGDRTATDA